MKDFFTLLDRAEATSAEPKLTEGNKVMFVNSESDINVIHGTNFICMKMGQGKNILCKLVHSAGI